MKISRECLIWQSEMEMWCLEQVRKAKSIRQAQYAHKQLMQVREDFKDLLRRKGLTQ